MANVQERAPLEKNLPDDNVGSDSTLGGVHLSWCGIVSLAGVTAVCIGGVATLPLQAVRFMSRFIPAEPGPVLSVVLCVVTIGCIGCMVPVWVPLCMVVVDLIFGVPVCAAHNFVDCQCPQSALWLVAISFESPFVRDSSLPKELNDKVAKMHFSALGVWHLLLDLPTSFMWRFC